MKLTIRARVEGPEMVVATVDELPGRLFTTVSEAELDAQVAQAWREVCERRAALVEGATDA